MPRMQIELDAATTEALTSLAAARGATPADLAADIVGQYVRVNDGPPPDPLDALVGSIDADPVDDIDEVIYGR